MLTFLRLGTKGNLGNQLFQIASTIGLSSKNNHPFAFPYWKYSEYFVNQLPEFEPGIKFKDLMEKKFEFHEWPIGTDNYNLVGWLQSEEYFDISKTKYYFEFKPELVSKLCQEYVNLISDDTILISVRRGDFVNNPHYFQLDYEYYLLALIHNFPQWEKRKLVFTSDDIGYCQRHFAFLPNAHFLKNLSPINQLILGSMFNNFIISNSTFSWWMAWLGEKKNSKIIRPKKNFRGQYELEKSDKDYFPERWAMFDHHQYKLPKKYYKLYLRGEYEKVMVNCQYRYKKIKKRLKKRIQRLIR